MHYPTTRWSSVIRPVIPVLLWLLHWTAGALGPGQFITDLIGRISADTMWQMISTLQQRERYSYAPEAWSTAGYIKNYLTHCHTDTVYYHHFIHNGLPSAPNIIAEKKGYSSSDSIIILCAHWDSYAAGVPGADDNASGTAGVLEAARILNGMHFRYTIRLICFASEEQGLIGSRAYTEDCAARGEKIVAVLNMDMIAYHAGGYYSMDIIPNTNGISQLAPQFIDISQYYVKGIRIFTNPHAPGTGTDIMSFWNAGYDGLTIIESTDKNYYSPYIHKPQDVLNLSANSPDKMHLILQSVMAVLATWAEPVIPRSPCVNGSGVIASFSIYPNPAVSQARAGLILNDDAYVTVSLYDLTGKLNTVILQETFLMRGYNEIPVSFEQLLPGKYLLKAMVNEEVCPGTVALLLRQ